ncbi:M20/M25/M40 family metallo-hydrolase [Bacillus lacus]|uniref:M20/M25/M40 family metallo-hydrolase n=1 Tax=Metabacillus lacus TaxID=1983721 RepID=A0A7X2IY47_9BACI|nr:M28 family metallopeptidase [Metabacillus lacus]MRX71607.1 M20/M25/M40 family metallo-hydrolase [Metabacillus lacus]
MPVKKNKLLVSVLSASLLFGSAGYTFVYAAPPAVSPQDQKVVARVDAARAIEHVRYLSENIGSRPGGLQGEKKSAEYIAKTLKSYGYSVEYQYFPVADQYIAHVTLSNGSVWEMGAAPNGKISSTPVKAEVVYLENTDPESLKNVQGKIVVVPRGNTTASYQAQVKALAEAKAAGVILQSLVGSRGNYGQAFNPSLPVKYDIPVFGASYIHGEWLKDEISAGRKQISLTGQHFTNLQSVNVIAVKKAKSKNPEGKEVILGAHHDSVVGAPGANDNASGVGLMLELARVYKGYNTDKDLKFIAFGSEERGLLGARYYVDQLNQKQRDAIEAVFVPDMVATSYEKAKNLYAMTPDGSRNIVTDSAVAAGTRLGNSDILPGTFGSSDHVPFHNAGIPAALFIWMGVDSWNPLVYHIEKVYHTPQDTIADNVSHERMQSALDIIGSGLFDVVRKK